MKFLNINATINVKPQFSGEVLKAGTPLDVSGAIANSDAAVGLVANDTAKGAESIAIVTEGTIDLTEVAASYGSALTDECIAALKGITFLYGGKAIVPSGGGGGGSGVTTLYCSEDSFYESSDFSTDPTFSDPSAVVPFADALEMIEANPASVAICMVGYGGVSTPCYARVVSNAIRFTTIGPLTQMGIQQFLVTLTEYSISEYPEENSMVPAIFESTSN